MNWESPMSLIPVTILTGFQSLGTLMAVGLLMLPAVGHRQRADCGQRERGLLPPVHHAALPSGPAIVLVAGGVYIASLRLGTRDGLRSRWFASHHYRKAQ